MINPFLTNMPDTDLPGSYAILTTRELCQYAGFGLSDYCLSYQYWRSFWLIYLWLSALPGIYLYAGEIWLTVYSRHGADNTGSVNGDESVLLLYTVFLPLHLFCCIWLRVEQSGTG